MDDDKQNDDKALYARFKAARDATPPGGVAVDLTSVAAWVDRRLSESETEAVELGFLADPDLLMTAWNARAPIEPEPVSAALLAKLQGLVPSETSAPGEASSATVLAFTPRRQPLRVRSVWMTRAAIAASLLLVSMAGLGVGVTAGQNFTVSADPAHPENVMELLNSGSLLGDDVG